MALWSHCAYTSEHTLSTLSICAWPKFFEIWYHCGWRMFFSWFWLSWIYTDVLKLNQQRNDLVLKSSTVNLVCFDIIVERNFEDQYTNCVLKHSWVIWKEGSQDRKRFAASDSGICGESVTTKARTNGPIPDKHCCHLMCRRRGASINYRLHLTSTEMNWTSDVTTIIYIRLLTTECLGLIFENCVQSSKAG